MATRGQRLSDRARALWLVGAAALVAVAALAADTASAAPPASGDWVVTASEAYVNQTIVIEGNVFVRAPGNLTLLNVTLQINSTSGARRGLLVEAGAQLHTGDLDGSTLTSLDRTVIRPVTNGERIFVIAAPGSSIDLRQTALWGIGYTQSPANASGVYVQTNATILRNVTVYASYFGIVFLDVVATFQDLVVHNNTYNGLDLNAGCNITVRGFVAADNGLSGVHNAGGRFTLSGASLLNNTDGLAVKFGGTAAASGFDASGNDNGFVALNGATLTIQQGRVTNNSAVGVDARQSSFVMSNGVTFSDNPTGFYASLGSSLDVTGGSVFRGIRAFQLRSGSDATLTSLRVEGASGDGIDIDGSSMDIFSTLFEGNAFGGQVVSSTGFSFLDSTLANSTGGGFTFTDSPGVYLHNPAFLNNKGRAVDLVGSTTALLDATGVAQVNGSVVEVDALTIGGALRLTNGTLQAVTARSWTVSGSFFVSNASIVGIGAGGVLTVADTGQVFVRGLAVVDFALGFSNISQFADVDGLAHSGSGQLWHAIGDMVWRNVTQGPGSGRVLGGAGTLSVFSGSIASLRVEFGGIISLYGVAASLGTATYGAGEIRQHWSIGIATEWQNGAAAPNQPYSVADAAATSIGAGTTDASGFAALGWVLDAVGTSSGVTSRTPHAVSAGSGSWAAIASLAFTSSNTFDVQLVDPARPSMAITAPASGARVSGTAVNITGNVADFESGLADLSWSFDNVTFTQALVANPFTVQVPAQFETTYLITLRATDRAGNAAFAQATYRVDRTAPFVSLTQPTNGSAVRGPTVRFAGATEIGATLTINGSAVSTDAAGNFNVNLTLGDGLVTIALTAVDAAGNVFFFEVQLRVDATPPGVVVFSPPNGSTVSALTAELVGFIEPGAGLWINGVAQLALSNGSFNVTVDLDSEGENRLLLASTDAAGNTNQTEWVLFRDTRFPTISILELSGSGPWSINVSSPDFTVTTDEYAFIEASVSPGGAASSASGTTLVFTPALTEGQHTLTVRATDAGGNGGTRTFTVRVDLTPPTFALDSRTESLFVNNATWRVALSAEAGASVTVGGVAALPTSQGSPNFEATITLQPGPNTVVIVVADAAGNRATRTLTLTLDLVPPSITIGAPAAGASTTQSQITVSGDTEPGATVTVMGRVVPVDLSGHFVTLVNIPVGTTSIVFTSTDIAGNTATVARPVTRTSGSSSVPGLDFLQENMWAIIVLIVVAAVAAGLSSRGKGKRAALKDRASSLERDLETSRAARNDLNALENFSPRGVQDPDFVSAEEFRRREAVGETTGTLQEPK